MTGTRRQVDRAPAHQPARRAAGVDQPADDAQQPPGAPQRERHGEHADRRDRGGGAVAEQRPRAAPSAGRTPAPAPPCRCRAGARSRSRAPPVPGAGRRRRESAAGDRAERLAYADDQSTTTTRATSATRVGEEARDEAGVLGDRVLVVRGRRRGGVAAPERARPPWRRGDGRRRPAPGWSRPRRGRRRSRGRAGRAPTRARAAARPVVRRPGGCSARLASRRISPGRA